MTPRKLRGHRGAPAAEGPLAGCGGVLRGCRAVSYGPGPTGGLEAETVLLANITVFDWYGAPNLAEL